MNILIATFCDAARADGDRVDILGAGIRVFFVLSLPATVHTWLATLVATDGLEIWTKQHALLNIYDSDLVSIGSVDIIVTTVKADRAGLGSQTAKATPIGLKIEKAGLYRAEVLVDDKVVMSWPFEVVITGQSALPFAEITGY